MPTIRYKFDNEKINYDVEWIDIIELLYTYPTEYDKEELYNMPIEDLEKVYKEWENSIKEDFEREAYQYYQDTKPIKKKWRY